MNKSSSTEVTLWKGSRGICGQWIVVNTTSRRLPRMKIKWLIFSCNIQKRMLQQDNKATPFQAKPPPLLLQPESYWLLQQAAQRSDQRAISRQLHKQIRPPLHKPPHDLWAQSPEQPCLVSDISDIRRTSHQVTWVPNSTEEDVCMYVCKMKQCAFKNAIYVDGLQYGDHFVDVPT